MKCNYNDTLAIEMFKVLKHDIMVLKQIIFLLSIVIIFFGSIIAYLSYDMFKNNDPVEVTEDVINIAEYKEDTEIFYYNKVKRPKSKKKGLVLI